MAMTVDDLEAYAARLNRKNFSVAQGIHWFVGKRRRSDGEVEHFLDNRKAPDMGSLL